ncbi:Ig-like domain-containing protein [Streptomyces sp. NPDC088816]|uniref:L,D-transpeptidase n=1 Tax=Streptomyces sp. NPDC088816 TaxID=3365906 RepID=UPI003816BF68
MRLPTSAAIPIVLTLLLAGCGADGQDRAGGSSGAAGAHGSTQSGKRPPFQIVLAVTDGQSHTSVQHSGRVTVRGGTLRDVVLSTGGRAVPGRMSPDGLSWRPVGDLDYGSRYRLVVTATYGDGRHAKQEASFTTLRENERLTGTFTPDNGSTVGVGMPVSFTFDKAIENKQAVEEAITVRSSTGQPVVGHWFGNQRIDFRPREYWKPHSTVSVEIALEGVKGADGAYGYQNKTVTFTVGRSQVSTVDAAAHVMKVSRDGKPLRTVPITAGAPESPTYNGQMVVSEKLVQTRMNGATVGFAGQYDIPDVPHAMRLSTSGTFIHGNYWGADSVFGQSNISHGCIGLKDVQGGGDPGRDGAWFYSQSLIGDVVIVKNSKDRTIAPDNGLNGWNMSWTDWQAGSATH